MGYKVYCRVSIAVDGKSVHSLLTARLQDFWVNGLTVIIAAIVYRIDLL